MTRTAVKMIPLAGSGQSLIDGLRIDRDIKLMDNLHGFLGPSFNVNLMVIL